MNPVAADRDAQVIDIALPSHRVRALAWGPEHGRPVICMHGFPDSAHSWRRLAPLLAREGMRVIAPFSRGYWPSALPSDGDYSIASLMSDLHEIHRSLGGRSDAVLIGHDWGGWTTCAMAAYPGSPFAAHISLAFAPIPAMRDAISTLRNPGSTHLTQLKMSWYVLFFQFPWVPQRLLRRVIPKLWRDWSLPGDDVAESSSDALDSLPTAAHKSAAVGYYRTNFRLRKPRSAHAALQAYRFASPVGPMLILYGAQDGCANPRYAHNLDAHLPPGSKSEIIDGAGHFVHVDQPERVCEAVLTHLKTIRLSSESSDSEVG